MLHRGINATQAIFVLLGAAGIMSLASRLLANSSAVDWPQASASFCWAAALLYVGVRFNHLIRVAPQRVIRLTWVGVGLVVLGAARTLAALLPSVTGTLDEVLISVGFLVGVHGLSLLFWSVMRRSVRHHADVAVTAGAGSGSSV